ncbi:helix-turn-helix domain-containing protein [Pseudomonas sp. UYIF39]|uniref:helix-turn-helix domain-containing protein n=1 Tax=Pseudomonas sp. UYIF39 TaxID=1630747 RepID=UPI00249F2654|nr:helix-turn-helix domain-containing protein [Pseudomonas sp. UYIF39]MDI3358660.1 helix-turn-helix domain-containing protein [Pseudomonas sp. UYIF39]
MGHDHSVEAAMSIGENIRIKRESKKISQKNVAEAIGVAENTVASWEKGKNVPPSDKAVAIAKFFQCTTDEILLDDNERGVEVEMLGLLRRFGNLNDTHKPIALNVISSILQGMEFEEYLKGGKKDRTKEQ